MPIWNDDPPADAHHFTFRICRTPPNADFKGIITSSKASGCPTHYYNHRTVPCGGSKGCNACDAGYSWRWHGYAAVMLTSTLEHVLFEFTAPTSDVFKNYHRRYNTLRGCGLVAKRPSGRTNGRVVVTTTPVDLLKWQLPEEPNLRKILCHIWGVPYVEETDTASAHQPIDGISLKKDNGQQPNPETGDPLRIMDPR